MLGDQLGLQRLCPERWELQEGWQTRPCSATRKRQNRGGRITHIKPTKEASEYKRGKWVALRRGHLVRLCSSASYHRRKTTEKRERPQSNPNDRLLFQMTPSACPARVIPMYGAKKFDDKQWMKTNVQGKESAAVHGGWSGKKSYRVDLKMATF